ncbi:MAG TPA: hypothetical protein VN737_19105 [Bryobacteraceae bacterium]|jgi:hypothetical protein|nr:hypothetical protein [Bryobacteraceae bacterium]
MSETQQQFIQDILNKVYPYLNQPTNQFYLPTFIQKNGLDPYSPPTGSTWGIHDLNDQSVLDQIGPVCSAIQLNADNNPCSGNQNYNAVPNKGPDITLSNIVVTGVSNAYVESATAVSSDGYTIEIVINFSTLSNYQSSITVTGNFSLTLYCCCGAGQTGCQQSGTAGNPEVGSGTFVIKITSSSAKGTIQITDLQEGTLDLEAKSVNYTADPKNISIIPTITSIPKNTEKSYNNLVQEAFSSADTLKFVLAQVNVQLNTQNALNLMGSIISKDLDAFLQANHQYPFGPVSSAAF